MRRLLIAAALCCLWAAPAHAATKTYSSGNLHAAIPDGGTLEKSIVVRDAGPISSVAVDVRLDHPRDSDLTLTLVSPKGTEVVLSHKRGGEGANYGSGERSCGGALTTFEDGGLPIAEGRAPFVDVYAPEEKLATLREEGARGSWTLRISDDESGKAGTLFCWQLTIGRRVTEHRKAAADGVRASLSYVSEDDSTRDARLEIRRKGVVRLEEPVKAIRGRPFEQPTGLAVRDLDRDGEPEVILDVYTGGAHCCTHSLIYRYDRARHRYRLGLHDWGNVGYRLVDLDRNGQPEFRSADDRFAYVFTSFAGSVFPLQIWHYDHGILSDVTRRFPGRVRADAAGNWRLYRSLRGTDPRGALAAWLADEYLLGRQDEGWRKVEAAYRRGEVGPRRGLFGWPQGRAYLKALRSFLRKAGYTRR